MTMQLRIQFAGAGQLRIFKRDSAGNPIGRGVLVRTMFDFSIVARENLAALIEIIIYSNWRIIVWLRGGRLK